MICLIISVFGIYGIDKLKMIQVNSEYIGRATEISHSSLDLNVENFHTQLEVWEYAFEPNKMRLEAFNSHNKELTTLLNKLLPLVSGATENELISGGQFQIEKIAADLETVRNDWVSLFASIAALEKAKKDGLKKGTKEYELLEAKVVEAVNINESIFDRLEFNKNVDRFVTDQAELVNELESKQTEIVSSFITIIIIQIVIISIIGILIYLFIFCSISKPLDILKRDIKIIGKGDLSHEVVLDSKDEFHSLAMAFNEMTADLKEKTALIEKNIEVRRQAEEGRKDLEAKLQQARRMESIGTLAGGIAHDFNNFLSGILGFTDLSKDLAEPGGEIHEYLSEAEKVCMRAKGLIQQFDLFSKDESPDKKICSIVELIEDMMTITFSGSKIKFEYFLPDDLWPVEFDKTMMKHVIAILVSNAKEAMTEGGTILVSAQNTAYGLEKKKPNPLLKDGKYVTISIQDHGKGIPEEDLFKLFDPYFSTKERGIQKGMGLGLSIAYSIVKKHGGDINIESEMGNGTTVNINLPAS
jgi:signal transduction histidine kinase